MKRDTLFCQKRTSSIHPHPPLWLLASVCTVKLCVNRGYALHNRPKLLLCSRKQWFDSTCYARASFTASLLEHHSITATMFLQKFLTFRMDLRFFKTKGGLEICWFDGMEARGSAVSCFTRKNESNRCLRDFQWNYQDILLLLSDV